MGWTFVNLIPAFNDRFILLNEITDEVKKFDLKKYFFRKLISLLYLFGAMVIIQIINNKFYKNNITEYFLLISVAIVLNAIFELKYGELKLN
jgi:hypothetical protein